MHTNTLKIISRMLLLSLTTGCSLNPQNADIDLNTTLPEAKVSVYTDAIRKLGMMNVIYGTAPIKVMSKDIADNTGESTATSFEIPRDITEMVKSTLNAVGGNVTYIQYDPGFLSDANTLGATTLSNAKFPDVIVSGGITEFDRGLVTKGDSTEGEITSGDNGLSIEDKNQSSLAEVTLDFNLIDFKTSAGFSRIQAVNGIKLHKGTKEDSIAFTIKSLTFGAKGTIKKVQGRHAAVRLLVELSMLQLLGRFQKLPYWRLVPNVDRDEVVLDQVNSDFYAMTAPERIAQIQTWLYLYGMNVRPNGQLDAATTAALKQFGQERHLKGSGINEATYLALFENLPIDAMTMGKRKGLGNIEIQTAATAVETPVLPAVTPPAQPVRNEAAKAETGQIKLLARKNNYAIGENVTVEFTVDKPLYVRVAYINSKGEITTLFPNPYQSDNFCQPNIRYSIPPAQADFRLTAEGPAGIDKIRAVASAKNIMADSLIFTDKGEFDDTRMQGLPIRAQTDIEIH